MRWLTDLIWIGNTLYPRWYVYGIILVAVAIFSLLIGSIMGRMK